MAYPEFSAEKDMTNSCFVEGTLEGFTTVPRVTAAVGLGTNIGYGCDMVRLKKLQKRRHFVVGVADGKKAIHRAAIAVD